MLAALAVAVLTGCQTETRVVHDGWGRIKELADPKVAPGGSRNGASSTYTIMLERFVGKDRLAKARDLGTRLRSKGLPDVDIQENAGVVTVSVGRFSDAGTPQAQSLLRRVRGMEIDGQRLYGSVNFIAAGEGGKKVYDPLDIRQYTGRYTLQIAFYDRNFQGDYKAAAEEAARNLREEGTDAYFYHGPYRSLVCVGLFTEDDFIESESPGGGFTVQRYGSRIRDLQKKFPYNLGNGLTLIEKNKETGQVLGEQQSCLVRVM